MNARRVIGMVVALLLLATAASAKMMVQWKHDAGSAPTSLICTSTHVFAGYQGGQVIALAPDTGAVLWKSTLAGAGKVRLAVMPDALFAMRKSTLVTLDPATGKVRSEVKLPFADDQALLGNEAVEGKLFIQTGGKIHVIDPATGNSLFAADHPLFFRDYAHLTATRKWKDSFDVGQAVGYFVDQNHLVAIDLKTGGALWKKEAPLQLFGAPTYFKGLVIAVGLKGAWAVNAPDGSTVWTDTSNFEKPVLSPDIYLVKGRKSDRFTLHIQGGLLTHEAAKERTNFNYFLPDISRLLYNRVSDTFFLFIYTEVKTGKWRSILFRNNMITDQIFGHSEVEGKATGLFVQTEKYIYPELRPGVLFQIGYYECDIKGEMDLSDNAFTLLDIAGKMIVVGTAEGSLLGMEAE